MGESYAALTWSGDVGATATGLVRHDYQDWEDAAVLGRTADEILAFYFHSSAPDFDLLADVDAWGARDRVPHGGSDSPQPPYAVGSVVDLLTRVYGPAGELTSEHTFARATNRAKGIREILTHYGFTSAADLAAQAEPVARMREQTLIVAKTFFKVQEGYDTLGDLATAARDLDLRAIQGLLAAINAALTQPREQELTAVNEQATGLFLEWLKDLADRYGVVL